MKNNFFCFIKVKAIVLEQTQKNLQSFEILAPLIRKFRNGFALELFYR